MNLPEINVNRFDVTEADLAVSWLPDDLAADGLELRGKLHGPRSAYAETVEIAYPLRPQPREGELVRARIVVPEPSVWSPKTPLMYHGQAEVWQEGAIRERLPLSFGLKELALHPRKGLRLNGKPHALQGVAVKRLAEADAAACRAAGFDTLLVPLREETLPLWPLADRLGFFVLGQVDPEDDAMHWRAHEALHHRTATLGWVLPQSAIGQGQLWHNAMSLLHGRRRDVFVGVQVDEPPVGVLPGHVDFILADVSVLPELDQVAAPRLLLTRRADGPPEDLLAQMPLPPLGWVARKPPFAA